MFWCTNQHKTITQSIEQSERLTLAINELSQQLEQKGKCYTPPTYAGMRTGTLSEHPT